MQTAVVFKNLLLRIPAVVMFIVVAIACKKEEVIPNPSEDISLVFTKLAQPV